MEQKVNPLKFGVNDSLFTQWRSPRFGIENPTQLNNKVWEWLIHSKISAYDANDAFNGPSPFDEGPTWCFDRFGQSMTELPDGRIIYIGGEHEDHYDPDFFIYNDVVVINPDGSIEIYGYPKDIFPPTDFHTATLVGTDIYIIGSLGYPSERQNNTQVYTLDTGTYKISKIETAGDSPGWIHDHITKLSTDKKILTIKNGKLDIGKNKNLIENIDDWQLKLSDFNWVRLTDRNWMRWEIKRNDKTANHLWEIRQALWSYEVNWKKDYEKAIKELSVKLGKTPNLDVIKKLYNPNINHEIIPKDEDEYAVYRISIEGIIVRYVEGHHAIQVTIEGELPSYIIEQLTNDLLHKFSLLENTECIVEAIA